MINLLPFETYHDVASGDALPLPPTLAQLYGRLCFPRTQPYVVANFVSTLDGVISLNAPGHSGGGDISGFNRHDQMLMGLLRASADAIIVGAAELRAPPGTQWTPRNIFPALEADYTALRAAMGKPPLPLQVVVTASGDIDLSLPVFNTPELPVYIVTNQRGAQAIGTINQPQVRVTVIPTTGWISARQVLDAVKKHMPVGLALIEGGPNQMRIFLEQHLLDELFLTLSPQVAGRDNSVIRPGFVAGIQFAPENPLWSQLVSLKRAGDHLFLRYRFPSREKGATNA